MAGEVVLFQGGGCEGSFGVEEAGELGDEGVALESQLSLYWFLCCTYSFEEVFQLRFKSELFFGGARWWLGHGGILGICMEEIFSLQQ